MQKLYTKAFVEDIGEKEGVIESAVITSEIVDREGEVLKADGGIFKNFLNNPQLLWMHNRREDRPPIGKVLKIWKDGNAWKFTSQFDLKDSFAADICRKIKEGFLNAFSVGFLPSEKDGDTYTKWEALEFSVVPVPANAEALVQLRSKGFETAQWKDLVKKEPSEAEVELSQLRTDMDRLIKIIRRVDKKLTRKKRVEDDTSVENIKTLALILNKATSKVLKEIKKGVKQ